MERMSTNTAALAVVLAESSRFPSKAAAARWLAAVYRDASELHRLYEGQCSTDLGAAGNATRASRVGCLERSLKASFATAGLGLYLNGDPRGNPVGILTPKTRKYNTMGGAEAGWRL